MLAPWIGGASAPAQTPGGVRSFVAFWMGGAAGPVTSAPALSGGGESLPERRRVRGSARELDAQLAAQDEQDLLDLLALIAPHL